MASKTKKDFTNIGSMATSRFLSPNVEETPKKEEKPVITARGSDIKSKRVNLLIYPSLFEKAKKISSMKQISFNEYLNSLISNDIEANLELISTYDKVFKK